MIIRIIIYSLCILIYLTITISFADQNDSSKPKKKLKDMKIIILPKTGHRKSVIKFNHLEHIEKYNTECVDCHHKATNKKCATCHLKKDQREIVNLKDAFHQQCHDCHRKTSGPKACGRCHIKNE